MNQDRSREPGVFAELLGLAWSYPLAGCIVSIALLFAALILFITDLSTNSAAAVLGPALAWMLTAGGALGLVMCLAAFVRNLLFRNRG